MPLPTENTSQMERNCPGILEVLEFSKLYWLARSNSGSLYFNYRKTFSVVHMALVDAHYNFIAIDVGAYGRNSDGGIFIYSKLGKGLDMNS